MEQEDWITRVNRTDDGFMPSFEPSDDALVEFLKTHGFVIVKILTPEECDATVASFWNFVGDSAEARGKTRPVPDDQSTWETENFPSRSKFLFKENALTQEAFDNRTHPRLHEAFTKIFGTPRLLSKVDKWGCMRGSIVGDRVRSDWRYQLSPHFDCNPHEYHNELRRGLPRMYQGILALVDCYDQYGLTTGGFSILPGCAPRLPDFCARVPPCNRHSVFPLESDEFVKKGLQHIPLRKGEVVIFDTGSLHANFPNMSSDMRIVQFVRMIDPSGDQQHLEHRSKHFPQQVDIPAHIHLSELGEKLMGRKPWK